MLLGYLSIDEIIILKCTRYSDEATDWMVRHPNPFHPERPDQPYSPHSLLFNGYRDFFPGVWRSRCEFDHSSSTSARLRMSGYKRLVLLYAFMAWTQKTVTFTYL